MFGSVGKLCSGAWCTWWSFTMYWFCRICCDTVMTGSALRNCRRVWTVCWLCWNVWMTACIRSLSQASGWVDQHHSNYVSSTSCGEVILMVSKLMGSMSGVVVSGRMIRGQWIEDRKDVVMLWCNVDHWPQKFRGTVIQEIEQSLLLHHFFLYITTFHAELVRSCWQWCWQCRCPFLLHVDMAALLHIPYCSSHCL